MKFYIEKYIVSKRLIATVEANGYLQAADKVSKLKPTDFVEMELDRTEIVKNLRSDDLSEMPKPKIVRREVKSDSPKEPKTEGVE